LDPVLASDVSEGVFSARSSIFEPYALDPAAASDPLGVDVPEVGALQSEVSGAGEPADGMLEVAASELGASAADVSEGELLGLGVSQPGVFEAGGFEGARLEGSMVELGGLQVGILGVGALQSDGLDTGAGIGADWVWNPLSFGLELFRNRAARKPSANAPPRKTAGFRRANCSISTTN